MQIDPDVLERVRQIDLLSYLREFEPSNLVTVIVAAITGQIGTKKKLPTHTIVHNVNGLDKDSIILLEQIRTIDKQRLQEYLGTLDGRFLVAVDKALAISVSLEKRIDKNV